MGNPHSYTKTFRLVPTLDTVGAYADGDFIGTAELQMPDVTNEGSGFLVSSISGIDLDKQDAAFDILFFLQEPSGTTFTNNGALDIADADLQGAANAPQFGGHVSVTADHYSDLADNSVFTYPAPGLLVEYKPATTQVVYVVLVCRGTPTYTSASNLEINITIAMD